MYKLSLSQDFWRLRIGVGRPTHSNIPSPPTPLPTVTTSSSLGEGRSIADYVLSNFSKEELPLFQADVMTKGLMMIEKRLKE
ncbi:hypothetical protein KA405_06370 [Patescibacteria group bacterium]|nr:hypothetical protein [Patescibacteria group bacterium]